MFFLFKMGQTEVEAFLKKHKGKWFKSRNINDALGRNQLAPLSKCVKHGSVERMPDHNDNRRSYFYRYREL